MLTQTALQSAFENPPELSARTNGGFVEASKTENTGEFYEMLTDKTIPSDTDTETRDILKLCSEAAECAPPSSDTENSKSSALNDYLGGFNALSGLLVRFWKKKELVESRKNSGSDQDYEQNCSDPDKKSAGNSTADELSELSTRRKKEQRSI